MIIICTFYRFTLYSLGKSLSKNNFTIPNKTTSRTGKITYQNKHPYANKKPRTISGFFIASNNEISYLDRMIASRHMRKLYCNTCQLFFNKGQRLANFIGTPRSTYSMNIIFMRLRHVKINHVRYIIYINTTRHNVGC